ANLTELYLRKNRISDISEVRHLAGLKKLRILWLCDNPCAQHPQYRTLVLKHLPWLEKLDNKGDPSERGPSSITPRPRLTPGRHRYQTPAAPAGTGLRLRQPQQELPPFASSPQHQQPAAATLDASEERQPPDPAMFGDYPVHHNQIEYGRRKGETKEDGWSQINNTIQSFAPPGDSRATPGASASPPPPPPETDRLERRQKSRQAFHPYQDAAAAPAPLQAKDAGGSKKSHNVLMAVMTLIGELDAMELRVVRTEVEKQLAVKGAGLSRSASNGSRGGRGGDHPRHPEATTLPKSFFLKKKLHMTTAVPGPANSAASPAEQAGDSPSQILPAGGRAGGPQATSAAPAARRTEEAAAEADDDQAGDVDRAEHATITALDAAKAGRLRVCLTVRDKGFRLKRTSRLKWERRGVGFCYACSISCHADHQVIELSTKRHFRCDCGTSRSANTECTLLSPEDERHKPHQGKRGGAGNVVANVGNSYDHNFDGRYCWCDRPYIPETDGSTMFQCVVCQDWRHEECIGPVPPADSFEAYICRSCTAERPFLKRYNGRPLVTGILRAKPFQVEAAGFAGPGGARLEDAGVTDTGRNCHDDVDVEASRRPRRNSACGEYREIAGLFAEADWNSGKFQEARRRGKPSARQSGNEADAKAGKSGGDGEMPLE
ncbi:MAG: hypothetical protein BJ554DRAFT_7072, partial [Olpidium bornovanus]